MTQYDNTNKGTLFRNNDRKSDSHPEFTGKINVDGKEYRLAAWTRTAKQSGNKFFSLSVTEFQQQSEGHQNQDGMGGNYGNEAARGGNGDLDDEQPF